MRLPVLVTCLGLGLVGACGSFGSDDPDAGVTPTTTEAGTAESSTPPDAGTDVVTNACPTVQSSTCGGTVQLLDFSADPLSTVSTTTTFSKENPCGSIHSICAERDGTLMSGFYRHELKIPVVPFHFRLRQRITGPVLKADNGGGGEPLTFGCGFFFQTDAAERVQARFEISNTSYEIDGDNNQKLDGGDPKGVKIEAGSPSRTVERVFDLDVTVRDGFIETTGTIDGVPGHVDPIFFKGTLMSPAELRCGVLQIDPNQEEPCDLTIRQVELEICP